MFFHSQYSFLVNFLLLLCVLIHTGGISQCSTSYLRSTKEDYIFSSGYKGGDLLPKPPDGSLVK